MSSFEKSVESVRGKTLTITSWLDETGAWKASAPGFILRHGRADSTGQDSRQAAVNQVVREMENLLGSRQKDENAADPNAGRRR